MDQILYIGIAQTFFSGLFIATRKPRILANQILAAWFFLICLEMILVLINETVISFYHLKVFPFTYGPLLFLYSRFMTVEYPRFRLRHLLHFLPFLLFLIVSLIFIKEPVMDGTSGFLKEDAFISLRIIYGASFFISVTAYSVGTFVIISKHQKTIQGFLSYRSGKVTLYWLITLAVIFYLGYVIMFIFGGVDILLGFLSFDPYEISFAGLILFAYLYAFFAYEQPSIFREIVREDKGDIEFMNNKKYSRSGLKKKDALKFKEMIISYMENSKPYLEREMTIHDMSRDLKIPRHFITEVLNEYMGKNFYNLINEYRVNEVKRRMDSAEYQNFTLLALAFDSGFNSKSAFNTIFKNITGLTPSEYKEEVSKK